MSLPKLHILMNCLIDADAVSAHSLLLKRRAEECGLDAYLYAGPSSSSQAEQVLVTSELARNQSAGDILLHQYFNETTFMPLVEDFPGRSVLMYHNITPPEFFETGSPVFNSCARGLRQIEASVHLYDWAVGMSSFSCNELTRMGFPHVSRFPLLLDTLRFADDDNEPRPRINGLRLLTVGRIAPNKKVDDLLQLVKACLALTPDVSLTIVGDDQQHPAYVAALRRLALELKLEEGLHFRLTGKISDDALAEEFRAASAFVSLSEHEGFCAPLIESMACGLPAFCYANPASEETMGGAGVVLRDKNFAQMAEKIVGVLADPRGVAKIVAAQRTRAHDFSPSRQREQIEELVGRVLRTPARTSTAPPVSVVINTYNRGKFLRRCLESLAAQSYSNFEVVVVNGPSTDETEEVLQAFAGKLRVARTPSRVLSVSRNIGIQAARGDLIAFIDDDAVADPGWLADLVKPFADPATGGAGGLVYRMNGGEVEFRNGIIDALGGVQWDEPHPGLHWAWQEGYLNTVSGNNCMFRRSALAAIGGFDERIEYYHDEADVVMRLAKGGFRTVHRPRAVVFHEAARSDNRRNRYDLNWFAIVKNTVYCALKNAPAEPAPARLKRALAKRIFQQRMRPIVSWWRCGEITFADAVRMEWNCAAGLRAGISQGLRPEPIYATVTPPVSGIEPYPRSSPPRLRIALLTQCLPEASPGGIATYTMSLAHALRDLGCQIHVLSGDAASVEQVRDGIWYHRVEPVRLPAHGASDLGEQNASRILAYANGVRLKVNDLLSRFGLDVVESPSWDSEGILIALEHRLPVVVRMHSPLFKVIEMQQWTPTEDLRVCSELERLLTRHADAISGSTNAVLSLTAAEYAFDTSRAARIPLGLAAPEPGETKNGSCQLLFAGRLELRKGIHTLLEALPAILKADPAVKVDIVGKDEPGGAWRDNWMSTNGEWSSRVRFHGELAADDLWRMYKNCDIFVAPSTYESFGLVYLEAMACGKPVIGGRTGGVPEVVLHGETGLLIEPESAPSLVKAVLSLSTNRALREKMGAAALDRYHAHFTPAVMARRTLQLYEDVRAGWLKTNRPVWEIQPQEWRRGDGTTLLWNHETRGLAVVAPRGVFGTIIYGPYIRLAAGSYRAEFRLLISEVPQEDIEIAVVDVFSAGSKVCVSRRIRADGASGGSAADVYFDVSDDAWADYEFRVTTFGHAVIQVTRIAVRRWPWTPAAMPERAEWAWEAPVESGN